MEKTEKESIELLDLLSKLMKEKERSELLDLIHKISEETRTSDAENKQSNSCF